MKRRDFVTGCGAGLLATAAGAEGERRIEVCAFEKPLQGLSYDELAAALAKLGFDGVEATVRPGGHVLPERVEEDLPKMVEAMKKRGLAVTVMATAVNRADDAVGVRVLKTAAALGVKRYRTGYYKYDLKKPVKAQLHEWRPVVNELAALNGELGLQGLYQNHAGRNYVGAPIWDLDVLLDGVEPDELGVVWDLRHATAEGGMSWPLDWNVIRDRVRMLYAKDFVWEGAKLKNVPLGEGRTEGSFYTKLVKDGLTVPISLHVEYFDHKKVGRNVAPVLEALGRDLNVLRGWLG